MASKAVAHVHVSLYPHVRPSPIVPPSPRPNVFDYSIKSKDISQKIECKMH